MGDRLATYFKFTYLECGIGFGPTHDSVSREHIVWAAREDTLLSQYATRA